MTNGFPLTSALGRQTLRQDKVMVDRRMYTIWSCFTTKFSAFGLAGHYPTGVQTLELNILSETQC